MNTTANTFEGKTAEEWLAEGALCRQADLKSFQNSDEDGWVSQKVNQQHAYMCDLKAKLANEGAWIEVEAIFDMDGNLIAKATLTFGDYGPYWYVPAAQRGQRGTYYNESQAKSLKTRVANNAKKGFYIGRVEVPATVEFVAGGSGMAGAMAGGYQIVRVTKIIDPAQVRIIDNGKPPVVTEPQPEPEPETLHCAVCDVPDGVTQILTVTNPENGAQQPMCHRCWKVADGIKNGMDSILTAYGITIGTGDQVETENGATGTVYRIGRRVWNSANDMDWQEDVLYVRWDAMTHPNGVTSPVRFYAVRIDIQSEGEFQRLASVNGKPVPVRA